MKKPILIVAILAIIGVAVFAYFQYQKKLPSVSDLPTDYSVTANELFDAFENDEAAATEMYGNKVLEITGTIDLIEAMDSTKSITLLADNAMIGGVNCQMNLDQDLSVVSEGQEVTIKGICQGYLMNVVVNQSIIVSNE